MQRRLAYATLLLLTSQLVAPALLAQTAGAPAATSTTATSPDGQATPQSQTPTGQDGQSTEEPVEISAPGVDASASNEIVVVGRNIPNTIRATPQIVSVLSAADIARTGEGDIAGALTRVTGLSVVGGGFVYVRGLGDRYSSSLLNGSPLPSPEPLRRSVPLDIFPTTIVGSALVQKTYSVNYPGEFGGGVINLTTKAIPTRTSSRAASRSPPMTRRPASWAIPMRAAMPTGWASTTARAGCRSSCATCRRARARAWCSRPTSRGCPTPRPLCSSATITCPPTGRGSCRAARCSISAATVWA